MTWLLAVAWVLPLLLAPFAYRQRLWWTPAPAALPALAAALWLPTGAQLEIPWLLLGSRLGLDETGRLFLAFTAVLWLTAGVYGAQSLKDQPHAGRFRAFFLLAMGGNLWLILAQDLIGFYVGFAIMGLASYGLVVHHGDRQALRAGRVYLAMTVVGELALFSALVLIAAQTGTLTPTPEQLADPRGLTIGLLLFGLAIKAGLVPLHVWLPLAHPAAPVPASAVLSGAMIKVALLGWLRFLPVGQVALPEWGLLLLFAGLITLFFAIPIGLVQSDPKVILAYSSVSKMGFLTLILGLILLDPALAPSGVLALVLYAAHHALAKGGLFLGVGLRHHGPAQPLVLVGLTVLALSLAGTPASGGAVAKYGLKPVLLGPDWSWLNAAVTLGALATTLLMARFLWVMWRMQPHPAEGHVWGGIAWVLLILLVLLYPWVLGSPAALTSGAGPVGTGILISGLLALVAWRRPRLLSPLVNQIGPGDLLTLIRPLLAVLAFLGRGLWRGWQWLSEGGLIWIQRTLALLAPRAVDPERRLRAWPTAGSAWLGIMALLLGLLLIESPPGPRVETAPDLAALSREEERPTPNLEAIGGSAPEPQDVPTPIDGPPTTALDFQGPTTGTIPEVTIGAFEGPELEGAESEPSSAQAPVSGPSPPAPAESLVPVPPQPESREAVTRVQTPPTPEVPETTAVTERECDPANRLVLFHPAVARPLELSPCLLEEGVPRQVPAPPLTNHLVELVQHQLRDLDYSPGPLDGLIGPRTREAVRRFQRDQGLAATGALSFDLLARLQSALAGEPDPGTQGRGTKPATATRRP